ncbi:MAG TPA: patatin-like phospholipase family protein, partial [Syntrophales bacterium]|nr:patatin-like phospholipase family protein [Syntrophales bacterium]
MSIRTSEPSGIYGPIGLSMSGGGSRAVAFHLGGLDYLDHAGLRSNLKMLSSVSGGSFTGAKYTLSLAEKMPYSEFFKDYYHILKDTRLVECVIKHLTDGTPKTPSGRKGVIVSAAQVYADILVKKRDGQTALLKDIFEADIPLREVAFNTTELISGNGFYFQRSEHPKACIGNNKVVIPWSLARYIRLADVVAASHCIPLVFEPMAFPGDFVWPSRKIFEEVRTNFPKPIPLMDGGLLDNQGIDSLLLSEERNPDNIGLVIISDVTQISEEFYQYPLATKSKGLTIGSINIFLHILTTVCILSIILIGYNILIHFHENNFMFFSDFFQYLIPLFAATSTALGIWRLRSILRKKILKKIPQLGQAAWNHFKKLRLSQLIDMINLRATSMLACMDSVLFNRIQSLRLLIYKIVFTEEYRKCQHVSNLIYHLKSDYPFSDLLEKCQEVPKPSVKLRRVADVAANMPTQFWYDHDYQLPCIVACGQASLCYNLMKHIVRVYGDNPELYQTDVKVLWDRFVRDWQDIVDDPYSLLKKRLPG